MQREMEAILSWRHLQAGLGRSNSTTCNASTCLTLSTARSLCYEWYDRTRSGRIRGEGAGLERTQARKGRRLLSINEPTTTPIHALSRCIFASFTPDSAALVAKSGAEPTIAMRSFDGLGSEANAMSTKINRNNDVKDAFAVSLGLYPTRTDALTLLSQLFFLQSIRSG